ncbi:sodium-coupled monocarboxylate transporter 1-like isoform X1 [Styela clava]
MTEKRTFAAADYVVFGLMLGISALIGIFYAIKDRRSKAGTEGYLMAGRSMHYIPVALSLTVSFMSAITVLGTPAEVYIYGTMYWWFVLVFLVVAIITSQLYIPTFYRLGISSTYEYLERRFNRAVRLLGTVTYIVQNIMYIGIVIYAPALALNEVTGFDLWLAVMSTGIVCTFYTTLGGLKAVIWTDVFQGTIMCAGFLAVIIRGSIIEGGFDVIWEKCYNAGRVDFIQFEGDYRIRHTFWSIFCGGTITWLGVYAVSQSQVQRYLCCRSARQGSYALFLNVFGLFVIISLACMCGMVMYAFYSDCDPLGQGCVSASDQLLPYLVMDILQDFPGIPGLFVSCVFSGSLSTVSSGINAMATVTIEDFIKPVTKWKPNTYTWTSKGLVLLYGGLCIGMAALASTLGEVLQAALSILGLVGGPLVGLFTLGLIFPFANSIGAFVGLLFGLFCSSWVYIGSRSYPPAPEYTRKLPFDNSGCAPVCYWQELPNATTASYDVTQTMTYTNATTAANAEYPPIADFYAMSYLYLSTFGMLGTIVVGLILSLITCGWRDRKNVDPNLLAPFFDNWIFKWIPEKFRYILRCCVMERDDDYHEKVQSMATMATFAEISPLVASESDARSSQNGLSAISLKVKYDHREYPEKREPTEKEIDDDFLVMN